MDRVRVGNREYCIEIMQCGHGEHYGYINVIDIQTEMLVECVHVGPSDDGDVIWQLTNDRLCELIESRDFFD